MSVKWLIAVLVAGSVPAIAQVPKPQEFRQALASVMKQREADSAKWQMKELTAVDMEDDFATWIQTVEPEARRFAMPLSTAKPDRLDAAPYRNALVAALHDRDPKIRGIACEVAADCWDLDLLPALGALLDDQAEAGPVRLLQMTAQQSAPVTPRSAAPSLPPACRPPVAYMAQWAIRDMIGIKFSSRATFDKWLSHNRKHGAKMWYWIAKWRHRQPGDLWQLIPRDESIAIQTRLRTQPALDDAFQGLDRRSQLLILASAFGSSSENNLLTAELQRDLGSTGQPASNAAKFTQPLFASAPLPDYNDIGAFLRTHGFHNELLACLASPDLRRNHADPETAGIASLACGHASQVFEAADEPALAKAQTIPGTNPALAEQIAVMRARLVPDRGPAILGEFISTHVDAWGAPELLASRFGSSGNQALTDFYRRTDASRRQMVAGALLQAATDKVSVTKEFLLQLLEIPNTDKHPDGLAVVFLAETAKVVAGRDVAKPEDVQALRSLYGKHSGPKAGREDRRRAANDKVREELLQGLKDLSSPPAK